MRRLRTRHEAKILDNAKSAGVNVPRVLKVDESANVIEMEFIDGRRMKDIFDETGRRDVDEISLKIGETIARLHKHNIIHNDLTTSNILLKGNAVYFIDFGLGYSSTRLEDKAMDLVVFKKSLNASHTKIFNAIWRGILEGYGMDKQTEKQMHDIEKRVRYASG